jgi:hypothetical protein
MRYHGGTKALTEIQVHPIVPGQWSDWIQMKQNRILFRSNQIGHSNVSPEGIVLNPWCQTGTGWFGSDVIPDPGSIDFHPCLQQMY